MAASRAYRGPADRQPKTISDRTVSGALLPCTAVAVTATQFSQATAVSGGRLALLANRDFYSTDFYDSTNPLLDAYTSGDTGVAYVLEPGQKYLWAAAAATYTNGQELTIGASGRVAAAASTNIVVAYFDGTTGAYSAGDLIEVEIANFYTKA